MPRKKTAKRRIYKERIYLFFRIAAVLITLFFLSKHKSLIIVLIFEALDIAKNMLRQTFPFIPIDLVFVFGIAGSYFYSFWIGVVIFFLSILNRTIFICLETRHMTKCVRHFIFFFSVRFFGNTPFFTVAMVLLTLNYVLKYGLNIARGEIAKFDKSHFHIINYIGSTMFFFALDVIYSYFPFLY